MQVLIIGGGGREHALAWKVAQSPLVDQIYVAPGNAGSALETKTKNVAIAADDIEQLTSFAQQERIELTIVGPEVPLTLGIVDSFQAKGLYCYGPCQTAAILEGSKAFAKQFMYDHNIPTAAYASFNALAEALDYLAQQSLPIVIKADGLAAGKGVVIAHDHQEAEQTLHHMFSGEAFGDAGTSVVIEEFLQGEEASFMVMCDGKSLLPLATSQDHKARDDGDQGPNTGGMGAYSPAPVVTATLHQRVIDEVMQPVLSGMAAQGISYTGFLYAGLMISPDGEFKVLEFNCRLGDPETQVLMLRLQSDLVELCIAASKQQLDNCIVAWSPQPALGVVLAAQGYPANYPKGEAIHGLDSATSDNMKIFHAGTKLVDNTVLSNGGRVLCAAALGDSFAQAQDNAYNLASKIEWPSKYLRYDIGYRVC